MSTIKSALQVKISTLICEIEDNPHSIEAARAFDAKFAPLIKKMVVNTQSLTKDEQAIISEYYSEENTDLRTLVSKVEALENYRQTMMLDLVKVDTDWVVTDGDTLISPAGFHPSERIVVRHKVMICLNEKPDGANTPRSNVPMYGHKMPAAI